MMAKRKPRTTITGRVPKDRLALSVLTYNPFRDGDEFRSDGWVYNRKKRVRKWHVPLFDKHGSVGKIWEPKIWNLSLMEVARWKAVEYGKRFHERVWLPAFEALWKVKKAHAEVVPAGGEDSWRFYDAHDSGWGPCFGYQWVDPPRKPVHLEIGMGMYRAEKRQQEIMRRVQVAKAAFYMALQRYFQSQPAPSRPGLTSRLVINDRIYWFHSEVNPHHVVYWEAMAFPEDHVIDLYVT